MLSAGFQQGIIQRAERLLFSLHRESLPSQLCNNPRPHINRSVKRTKTSAEIWTVPLFSLLCLPNHGDTIRARPDLTRVHTVKSVIDSPAACMTEQRKSETWITLDSTGWGKNNWRSCFASLIDEGKQKLHHCLHLHLLLTSRVDQMQMMMYPIC